jgi:NTE family protein
MAVARKPSKKKTVALILGGGAPNATLMAGALCAFIDRQVSFDLISTSGAGALIGLLYTVPKNHDPKAALRSLVDLGINDQIYSALPVNYKVFNKPGLLADAWRQLCARNPLLSQLQQQAGEGATQQLFADWTQLLLATLCPSNLSSGSTGLCAHVPFIEQLVDFAALATIKPQFYLNAYNLSRHEMTCWDKHQISQQHFLAALSFPFLYPPTLLDGDYYIEGAAIDTLNFKGLLQQQQAIDSIVVFDVLGCENIMHPPTDLYDAWVQSIITPLIELARDDLKLFAALHNTDPVSGQPKSALLRLNVAPYLTAEETAHQLDWSRSNLERLFDVGYEAGHAFCSEHALALGI